MIRAIRFLALVALLAGAVLHTHWNVSASDADTVTVIVELKDEPAARYAARARRSGETVTTEQLQAYRANLGAGQDAFLRELAASGINATVTTRAVKGYDGSVAATVPLRYTLAYNGVALTVPSSAVSAVAAMPQVKKVHPNTMFFTSLHKSVGYINAPKVYGAVKELTQFDDFREGYEGQGVNISVIDTGIDWTNPMFGGDPTPPRLGVAPEAAAVSTNRKVIYNLPLTDSHVGDGFGHGTHVASTAAGYLAQHPGPDGLPNTADDIRLHGVAPQARLMTYTVCSTVKSTYGSLVRPQIRALNPTVGGLMPAIGGCETADIIMAVEDSVSPFTLTGLAKPVAHVINLSLGGGGGPDQPTAVACSNAALTGTTVVAASGNSGPGEGTTGAPAAGTHVISVGATTHPGAAGSQWSADVLQASAFPATLTGAVTPAGQFQTAAGYGRLRLFAMQGSAGLPAGSAAQRYVFVNNTLPFPATVAGRIALVKDFSTVTFFDMVTAAQQAGAVGVLVFDDRGAVNGVRTTIPAATIATADGEILVDALSSSDNNDVDPPNGAVSELPIRMNPFFSDTFVGEMAGFSSRGPVRGFGQIKPDISAPGVAVLAAVPPASLLGALATALAGTPQYYHLDGTSMASPHTAGVAALLKQAHPDWSPDMIRTALINTATNMRDQSGAPMADGLAADSIIAQGGGLIDTYEALHAKALMGAAGDGLNAPGILGSHSYGEVPVANSRVTSTHPVAVTVRDLSGQGGTYNLGVANNRDLQLAGINVSLSQQSVTLAPNGSATFSVTASFDGDVLRDVMAAKTQGTSVTFERIQMQWFVTARRADNAESLRMPFYFRPGPSLPAETTADTSSQNVLVPAGDVGNMLADGVTYVEVPFEVSSDAQKVEVQVAWLEADTAVGGLPDVDYELLDPSGNVVASSGAFGGPEFVSHNVKQTGTYRHRIVGYANAATDCTITTTFTRGAPHPELSAITGDFADSQGRPVDFDGAVALSWSSAGGERGYEVERSTDNAEWATVASTGAGQTGVTLADQPDGENFYRVRALFDGRIGYFVTRPSNVSSVTVSRRVREDITSAVEWALVDNTVSSGGGVFQFDQTLRNKSADAFVPLVEFRVVRVNSASGTVTVANADNNGDGRSAATAALFDYSQRLGADELFSAGEVTGARTLRFNVPRSEMFTYDVLVTGYRGTGGGAQAAGATTGGGGASASSTSDPLGGASALLRFTVNPLTRTVSAKLVSLKL